MIASNPLLLTSPPLTWLPALWLLPSSASLPTAPFQNSKNLLFAPLGSPDEPSGSCVAVPVAVWPVGFSAFLSPHCPPWPPSLPYPMLFLFTAFLACLEHSSLFKVIFSSAGSSALFGWSALRFSPAQQSAVANLWFLLLSLLRTAHFQAAGLSSCHSLLASSSQMLVFNYERFNRNSFSIHSWSWNYRGCWHQTCPPIVTC